MTDEKSKNLGGTNPDNSVKDPSQIEKNIPKYPFRDDILNKFPAEYINNEAPIRPKQDATNQRVSPQQNED